MRHIALTYHGIHNRPSTTLCEKRLLRNFVSENSFFEQLKILKSRLTRPDDLGRPSFYYKGLLAEEFLVTLTFDDGYRNNFRAAELICDVLGCLPLMVFLTTSLIDSNRSIWTVELALLILFGRFANESLNFDGRTCNLGSCEERMETFNFIRNRLKQMNANERLNKYDSIVSEAIPGELDRLYFEYPEFQMLKLDDIKQMQEIGIRFQPHGHNHEIFHSNQDPNVISTEITDSKDFVEQELKETCEYFAYPNGDYCPTAVSVLKQHGFIGAYTTRVGIAESIDCNFEIPRFTPSSKSRNFKKQLRGRID